MKRKIIRTLLLTVLLVGAWLGYTFFKQYQEHLRKKAYYENIVDTSSPTVRVLRDSILIPYQNHKRTLHIYVPPAYEQDSLATYPVIYLLDGESSFNDLEVGGPEWQVDEVINAAAKAGKPTAIVVGINEAENRDAEYTPFVNEDNPDAHGAQFAEWVATDLKQWVDTHYRTRTEAKATTIGGISRSGMMAYYLLMAHPDVFGNALIQSPSMWVDPDRLLAMELSETQLKGKKVFVSVGEEEGNNMIAGAEAVHEKFSKMGLKDSHLRLEVIPDEAHWHITWRKSFAKAYPWLVQE